MEKAYQASLLIRVGSLLIVLENLWYLYIEFIFMSRDLNDKQILNYFKMIWYGVLILDLLGFGGIGVGMILKSQILNSSERYLQGGFALLIWVVFSFLWRFILVGNVLTRSSSVDEFFQKLQTALVFIIMASVVMSGGFLLLKSTKQVATDWLFNFSLLNLVGSVLLWKYFTGFDTQTLSSNSLDVRNTIYALTLKSIIIPLAAIVVFANLALSEKIDPSELPSETSTYTY